MNLKLLNILQIIAVIFSIIVGTLLHFSYNVFSNNLFIASFSAVNESVWEHLKLVFFPMFIFSIIEFFFIKKYINTNNYIFSKTIAIIFSISFVTFFFYTYTGIIGTNYFILDILSFIFAIIFGELISYKIILKNYNINNFIKFLCFFILLIFLFLFIFFTYYPPKINYFKDPITNNYGLIKIE